MPSIFSRSRSSGSKKDKRPKPLAVQSTTLPSRSSWDLDGVASPLPRPDSAGFRRVSGYRQEVEVGEFGTTPVKPHTLPSKNQFESPPLSESAPPALPPKYSFLPLHIPSSTASSNSIDSFAYSSDEITSLRPYGILAGLGSKIILGIEEVGKVVKDVGAELEKRALATPWLFSNQALDLDQARVKRLINAYIESLGSRSLTRSNRTGLRPGSFQQDLQFAKEHELAWLLRWALSRITRLKEGSREVCHGMLEWEVYEEWRGRERAAHYPLDAFPYLSALIPSNLYDRVLTPLFQLLSRFAAHSHLSGLTPHALSSLFAPLIFDIPASSPAMLAHATFVQAASATEHLLLAFVRSQSTSKSELGVKDLPTRLREWVIGYPSMLATDAELARGNPRKGAKMVRCERVSRVVRAYTRDLVVHAELWASEFQDWDQWNRVILTHRSGEISRPKSSTAWKRKMAVKETLPLPASASDLQRQMSYGKARAPGASRERDGRERKKSDEEEARFGSLAGKEWSMFEEGGFDAPKNESDRKDMKSRLQFDLTESAKTTVSEKRQTMNWSEFASSSGGFSRTDPHLAVSLTFAEPLSESITSWPSERDALQRKLHKSQKDSIPFHYDTSIRLGVDVDSEHGETRDDKGRVWIEEAFMDCWADLMMGSGWVERDELTFKESNWVLVEYKARPSRGEPPQDPLADPRTSDICIIFEETVPLDYQLAIANPQQKKRFANMFSSKNRRRESQNVQHPSLARRKGEEQDFDRMLMSRSVTKKVSLGAREEAGSIWHREPPVSPNKPTRITSSQSIPNQAMVRKRTKSTTNTRNNTHGEGEEENKASFFSKPRIARRVKTNEDNRGKARKDREKERAREHEVDFEIHSASGVSSGGTSPNDKDGLRPVKKVDDEEKWMDILIANGAKRMDRQDAKPPRNLGVPPTTHGLPASPRPQHHQLPPTPHAAPTQHTPELSYDNERSADDEAHSIAPATPRASAFSHEGPSPRASEEPEDPYAHGLARRHQGHSPGQEYRYSDEEPRYSTDAPSSGDFTSRSSGETSDQHTGREREGKPQPVPQAQQREIPIIAPIPTRDTIHGIVSQYAQRHSMVSYDSRYDDDSQASISMSTDISPNKSVARSRGGEGDEDSGEDQFEELKSPLHPPVPTFDLTPGREPSPMRYRHGEPLQFVGEEDETAAH